MAKELDIALRDADVIDMLGRKEYEILCLRKQVKVLEAYIDELETKDADISG